MNLTDEQRKRRDELAEEYFSSDDGGSYMTAVELNIFHSAYAYGLAEAQVLVSALEHPDIEELGCECGYFEKEGDGGVFHVCLKCTLTQALAKFRGEK